MFEWRDWILSGVLLIGLGTWLAVRLVRAGYLRPVEPRKRKRINTSAYGVPIQSDSKDP